MSYILDALRRAEAQRSRGRPPGLHEATTGGAVLAGPPTGTSRPYLPLVLLLLGAGLVAGLIVIREPAAVVAPARPELATGKAAPAMAAADAGNIQSASASGTVEEKAVLALPRQAVLMNQAPAVPAPPPKPATGNIAAVAASAAAAAKPEPPAALPGRQEAARTATPQATTTRAAAAASALPSRQQLPQEIQRALPQIVVSGTVYSPDPAQRMLVVNGELWREGDQIRPGLILQEIRRRDAVLRFGEVSFTVSP